MKVEKLPPLKCPKCGSTHVTKNGKTLVCEDCRVVNNLKTGQVKPKDRNWHAPKGYIPKEKEDY